MAKDWVREAELLVEEVLDREAAEVDRSGVVPPGHFDALAERGFYGFPLSEGMTPDTMIDTASTLIGGCLATGFVWAQHLGALRAVAFADNAALRERYLARMTAGTYRCGVSYAGARSAPTLFVEAVDDGMAISGTAPFVTGWEYVDAVVMSVRVTDGAAESVATLLVPTQDASGVTVERIPLIAADASATVRLTLDRTFVSDEHVIAVKPLDEFQSGRGSLTDWINGALSLGVLSRCVRELKGQGIDAYDAQYAALRTRFAAAMGDAEATYALRADIAEAAVRAAAAGIVATGSRATLSHTTAERRMRQASFALVCTTREPIKDALLDRLRPVELG
ncbi:alkylation response protein AidB-like acyl-CoA dehydrogenase [Nocardia bhagyanarayanae]|uniref:Alkylation response protein AidB-like acyl-CoA dehydrogenase n=2 Tax=Nocardia bhagyanarayanae TaxID=1215925 RepID=A0A543EXA8_9NOCA|nr:alkylation response protein AidB-like acyl-CoA dehydrogenase [Nocardia bhagyanarayanae]